MKKYNKFIIVLLALSSASLLIQSCNISDFGDTNVNPNATSIPITQALLTNAITGMGSTYALEGLYPQYISQAAYTDQSRYSILEFGFGIYSSILYDLENIIINNTGEHTREAALNYGSNNNQIAVARILKVFFFSRMTDRVGDIPYFEALKGNPKPVYDKQENIYKDFFKELDEAVKQFDEGISAQGDILFEGNIERWKKFANSLRLILALRVSKADAELGRQQVNAALNSDAGVITINEDNAVLLYPGGDFRNPWFNRFLNWRSEGISEVIVNYLSGLNDPRLKAYGEPNENGEVVGIPYGVPRDMAVDFTNNNPDWSLVLAPEWRQPTSPYLILGAADIFLARAEAAAMGWTNENAAVLYRQGLEASLQYWEVFEPTAFEDYMAGPGVAITESDALDKIRMQRWISFFPNGYQGWSFWRRTGVPDLQPTAFAVNTSGQIPRRFIYWSREVNLNPENYQAAADRMGGDTMDSRVWWDKQ